MKWNKRDLLILTDWHCFCLTVILAVIIIILFMCYENYVILLYIRTENELIWLNCFGANIVMSLLAKYDFWSQLLFSGAFDFCYCS